MTSTYSRLSQLLRTTGIILSFISFLPHASAADIIWDTAPGTIGAGNGSVTGGAGTWNTSNGNWTVNAGANNIAWVNGSDIAVFSGSAGAVNLATAITAGGLTFNSTGYALSGDTLTLAGTPFITVGTGFSASIASVISGTGSLEIPQALGYLQIGRSNSTATSTSGTFNQSGGTAIVTNLGMGGASNTGTTSTLNLTGGDFSVTTAFVTTAFVTMAAGADSTAEITIANSAYVVMPAFPTTRGAGSTATLTFDGGTIRPIASNSAYISGLDRATIKAGGATFSVTADREITVPQPLLADAVSTGGDLTKAGLGGLELSGINTYQGPTQITAGSLIISGEIHAASAVTVNSGATLGGSGSAPGTITSPGTIAPPPRSRPARLI